MSSYINNPWISPLVNGTKCSSGFFKERRGLRQGCPLSSLLYIIIVKSLNKLLKSERNYGNLPEIKIVRGDKSINHSQFIDDTLLLEGASTIMMWRFQKVLDLYLQASEGLINHNKCHIYAWNVNKTLVNAISSVFQFPHNESWTSFKYLGMPISLWSSSSHLWQQVISKIKAKFTLWWAHWLNPEGCLVLIKSIL